MSFAETEPKRSTSYAEEYLIVWLHGCEGLHRDVVDKNPKAPAANAYLFLLYFFLSMRRARQRSVLSYDCPRVLLPRTPVVSDNRQLEKRSRVGDAAL